MLEEKTVNLEISEDNLYLYGKEDFSLDYEYVFSFLRTYAEDRRFKKIEINFGGAFFEITDLLEELIKNSYLHRNGLSKTEVVLNLGKIDLPTRIEYLHSFRKLKIKNYKINYLKKSNPIIF